MKEGKLHNYYIFGSQILLLLTKIIRSLKRFLSFICLISNFSKLHVKKLVEKLKISIQFNVVCIIGVDIFNEQCNSLFVKYIYEKSNKCHYQ